MRKGIKKIFDFWIFLCARDGFVRNFRAINIKQVRWGNWGREFWRKKIKHEKSKSKITD
jgi:hypothetical protein